MFKLLYKELRLAAHPTYYVFMLMGALVLIPNYPYGVVFMFGCLGTFITFQYGRETRDIYYTALLPIKKSGAVKSKCLFAAFGQLTQLLLSIPFAFLRVPLLPDGNIVGIEANVAFYGFGLLCYALFNLVFYTQFYKTAYKVGKAFLLASIPMVLIIVGMETLSHFPGLQWLDSVAPGALVMQLPILAAGAAAYIISMALTYKISARRFERVDL